MTCTNQTIGKYHTKHKMSFVLLKISKITSNKGNGRERVPSSGDGFGSRTLPNKVSLVPKEIARSPYERE
jgi:hypothetical protein